MLCCMRSAQNSPERKNHSSYPETENVLHSLPSDIYVIIAEYSYSGYFISLLSQAAQEVFFKKYAEYLNIEKHKIALIQLNCLSSLSNHKDFCLETVNRLYTLAIENKFVSSIDVNSTSLIPDLDITRIMIDFPVYLKSKQDNQRQNEHVSRSSYQANYNNFTDRAEMLKEFWKIAQRNRMNQSNKFI